MGERTSYPDGVFSWVDLTTTDVDGSKRFYADLLGWEYEDLPVSADASYSMARVGGKNVAAISPQPDQQREAGVPPAWNNYVTTSDVDAAAARAGELGGAVHAGPFDVMDAGRMAVVQDPQGAFFMLWQARESIGAQLVNAPGALCWNELATTDVDAATSFYSGLLGWEVSRYEGEGSGATPDYWAITCAGRANGGIRRVNEGEPPNWSCYFAVEEVDRALPRAQELGATSLMPVVDMGFARFAPIRDPQGAVVTLYSGTLED